MQRKPRAEPRMATLNVRVPVVQLLAVAAVAYRENRTLSAMTRILLAEALAARAAQSTERKERG